MSERDEGITFGFGADMIALPFCENMLDVEIGLLGAAPDAKVGLDLVGEIRYLSQFD